MSQSGRRLGDALRTTEGACRSGSPECVVGSGGLCRPAVRLDPVPAKQLPQALDLAVQVVAQLLGLAQRQLQDLLGPRGEGMRAVGALWPWPMISSTWARTPSSEMPSDSSALAATPSASWINPSSRCSVPT
jgi:hypothetical protein